MNESCEPDKLCEFCEGMILGWKLDGPVELSPFGKSKSLRTRVLKDAYASSLDGCHLCSVILEKITHLRRTAGGASISGYENLDLDLWLASTTNHWTNEVDMYLEFALRGTPPAGRRPWESIQVENKTLKLTYPRPKPAGWSVSTGSDAMFDLAKEWLNECTRNHPECTAYAATPISRTSTKTPSHLIEVSSDGTARLRITANLPEVPKWVVLSHCWGPNPIFTTTTKNIDALLEEIPLDKLPKTFRDAIEVARRLSQRYLWIDSLCITQDSSTHWIQESAIMGSVYRNAAFTIAAAGAVDGTVGCFRTRNPLACHAPMLDLPNKTRVHIAPSHRSTDQASTGVGKGAEPLYSRGWVVQETILSPRALVYGSRLLMFECVTACSSDLRLTMDTLNPSIDKETLHNIATGPITYSPEEIKFHRYWWRIVMTYTKCQLKYETDRLVAINGIIGAIEYRTGFNNIAGLWRESFISDLLWYAERPAPAQDKKEPYVAPTWSWASARGPVVHSEDEQYERTWLATLISAEVTGKAINGQIDGAYAIIRGPMRKIKCSTDNNDRHLLEWDEFNPDGSPIIPFSPDAAMREGQDLWALQILHCTGPTSWMNCGLVVERTGNKEGEWRRVGNFRQYEFNTTSDTTFVGEVEEMELYLV